MKTLTLLLASTAVMAMAQTQDIKAELAKVQQTEGGIQIRYAPQENMVAALSKLGGNVTVDFGDKKLQARGGVVIGSGADGEIAVRDSNAGGNVAIPVPVAPKMSITVSGRSGSHQKNVYCVQLIGKRINGVLPSENIKNDNPKCNTLNSPIRVQQDGTYLVYFNSSISYFDLEKSQNLVVSLREIAIPKHDGKVQAYLLKDEDSKTELGKGLYYLASAMIQSPSICTDYRSFYSLNENICEALKKSKLVEEIYNMLFSWVNVKTHAFDYMHNYLTNIAGHNRTSFIGIGADGSFFSVLPGTYKINWRIDGSDDVTSGIVVE